jgi:hypothetical protein
VDKLGPETDDWGVVWTDLRFDRFYNHGELTTILEDFASSHGSLCTIESIGTSHDDELGHRATRGKAGSVA